MHGLKKVFRDLWATRGRGAMMVLALAAGMTAFGSALTSYGVLTREIRAAYLETLPGSATLEVHDVSEQLLERVRSRPEIAAAERRRTVQARFRRPAEGDWGRALLFVVDDFEAMSVARVRSESGAWPPPLGTVLIERSVVPFLDMGEGGRFWLKTPSGRSRPVRVSGVVHEPALAPANQEQTVYAYATVATLAWLGEEPRFDELRVLLAAESPHAEAIEAAAQRLAEWLTARGEPVHQIRVPPPGEHPHERPMRGVFLQLMIFAVLVLLLSGILTSTLVSTLLARQVREIGVMKTVGARSRQIAGMYLVMMSSLAITALSLSALPTWWGSRAISNAVAELLNFDLANDAWPLWAPVLLGLVGLGLPVATALPTILRGSRITVAEANADHGVREVAFGRRRLDRLWGRLGGRWRLPALALRNALRRRTRFALTLSLLATGGGMFVGALSMSRAWEATVARVFETRHYDVELQLTAPHVARPLVERLQGVPGVGRVEAWGRLPSALSVPGRIDVVRTYPDQGHGSFSILAPPSPTHLIEPELLAGRWLRPGDTDVVVVNQLVAGMADLGEDPLGQPLTVSLDGRPVTLRVVGVVAEVGAAATAYVSPQLFEQAALDGGRVNMLRVATATGRHPDRTRHAIRRVEASLEDAGVGIDLSLPLEMLHNAMSEHVDLLIRLLVAMATLMGIVGAAGLGSAMSSSVIERTRELGMMRATGARPAQVAQVLVIEGLFVGSLSIVLAALVAIPFALYMGDAIGQLSFRLPLPLQFSWPGLGLWSAGVFALSVLASLLPARAAARLTIRETLAYV